MPTLTVCMIARNEEAHLVRCLESVREVGDDLVLVDTGSTDRTVEIARSFGARVFHLIWPEDFSVARNFAITQATGDWILSIDADESIAVRDHVHIRDLLSRHDVDAVTVPQRNYLTSVTVVGWEPGPGGYDEGAPFPGFIDVPCVRLFRNREWLRFRNRVHEELVSTDSSRPIGLIRGDWVIHHFGKAGDREVLRSKAEAYLRIGMAKVAEHPDHPHAHYELGVQYSELDQPEAALGCYERALTLSRGYADTHLRIAMCHARLGQPERALTALRLAARSGASRVEVMALEEGNAHRALGDVAAAERAFRRALATNPGFVAASLNLALICEHQNRLAEALTCLDRALERCPGYGELRMLRARIRRTAGDHRGALGDLDQLGSHSGALRLRVRILTERRRFQEAREALTTAGEETDAEIVRLRGAVALGLGEVGEAVAQLRLSLDLHASDEAARNLSTALELQGDRTGALAAAAEALRLSPDDESARARVVELAGDRFRSRAPGDEAGLTLFFFCRPSGAVVDAPAAAADGESESAMVHLAVALARRGHRVVVLHTGEDAGRSRGVESVRWETLPTRCLTDRPDVIVGVGAWQPLGNVRFAPLQIAWSGAAGNRPFIAPPGDGPSRAEIDFFLVESDGQAETVHADHHVPAWQIVRAGLGFAAVDAPTSGVPRAWPAVAEAWDATCRAALADEPAVLARIATHVAANRAGLAHRMVQREPAPAGLAEAWEALRAFTAWRAGGGGPLAPGSLQRIALHFRSFRSDAVLDQRSPEPVET
jgi:tetratricopeptide (TPR) repeat protein